MHNKIKNGGWLLVSLLLPVAAFTAANVDRRLVEAVRNRDQAAVRSLLKQRVDVNAPQEDGATALAWAAQWNELETAELLIRAGANVNAANNLGVTPLSLACGNGNAAMVERFLKAGADAKAASRTGETVLMSCVRGGSLDAMKSLLARGADVNAKGVQRGQTALMWAVAEKHPEIARVLIEKGADVHARSKSGFTPLLFAARSGDLESARMLVEAKADVNAAAEDGSAVMIATASGHESLAIFLLDNGANPNAAEEHGVTALHYAMQRGLSAVRGLHTTSNEGWAYFFRPNLRDVIQALLAHGANPNAPLEAKPRLFGPFLGSQAPNYLGSATPLILAAASGDAVAVRMLLAAGADPKRVTTGAPEFNTQGGATALMMAAAIGGGRRVPFKKEDDNVVYMQNFDGVKTEKEYFEVVKVLVEETGADVNAADQAGSTALHYAAWRGADTVVQYLVDKGAKINAKDMYGQTPLSIAEVILPMKITDKGKAPYELRKSTAELLRKLGAAPVAATQGGSRYNYLQEPGAAQQEPGAAQ